MPTLAIILVYVVPTVLAMAACLLAWRVRGNGPDLGWLEVAGLGLALFIGFCALEGRWPWELHSPWRRHYWIPVGLFLLTIMGCCRAPLVVLAISVATFLGLLLRKYAFQLDSSWSDRQHLALVTALIALAVVGLIGQWRLSSASRGNVFLVHAGAWIGGAILYAFFGFSSAKVAQWMSIAGVVAAGLFLLTLWWRQQQLSKAGVLVSSWFVIAGLLYGFYSGEDSILLPLIVLMVVPCSGYLVEKVGSGRRPIFIIGWTAGFLVLAIGAYFLTRPSNEGEEEDDGYLDAYGLVTPQLEAVVRVGIPVGRRCVEADRLSV